MSVALFSLLSACAGNQAMQWRKPPPPAPLTHEICDEWECQKVTKQEFDRFMRELERQMRFPQ